MTEIATASSENGTGVSDGATLVPATPEVGGARERRATKAIRRGRKSSKRAAGKTTGRRGAPAAGAVEHGGGAARKAGSPAPFPRTTFENALALGHAIQVHGAGQKMRRDTLFEKLDKSPESGPSRAMVTNSSKYSITTGGYQAEYLELTPRGQTATSPESGAAARLRAASS